MITALAVVACTVSGFLLMARTLQVRRLSLLRRPGSPTVSSAPSAPSALAASTTPIVQSRRRSRRVPAGTSTVDDLAFDLDLVAVCLQAGLPIDRALEHAVRASGDRSGLAHIARSARLGLEGDARGGPAELASVVAVIRFSGRTGVALAPLLQAHADELRRSEHRRRQIAAARLGVMLVMPLGVCVLPAFVLLGVVPVLLTLLGDLTPALIGS